MFKNISNSFWNTILLAAVNFVVFLVPVLPPGSQQIAFRIAYTTIYITAVLSLEKRSRFLLSLFFATLVLEWISGIYNMPVLSDLAKGTNVIFFIVIVFSLIRQLAMAREVTAGVILGSIAGYLLLGVVFSAFVTYIMQHDPGAFTAAPDDSLPDGVIDTSRPFYFTFVTLATLGFGDIVPLKPYSRSFTTFVAVCGQFYIAVIVALLVGKFAAARSNSR